jgi:hypothetical protein
LVALVTLLVKVFRSPITLLEKVCTPVTIEAAKSAPGREARPLVEGMPEPDLAVEPPSEGLKVGS